VRRPAAGTLVHRTVHCPEIDTLVALTYLHRHHFLFVGVTTLALSNAPGRTLSQASTKNTGAL
jgi:hypothetical protein